MNRCKWCNVNNPLYVEYHDNEWGVLNLDEKYLFEMLILESFQAGISWECVLNKRKYFKEAYDNFDIEKIINYNDEKLEKLMNNKNIIRNKLKIKASINNAKVFMDMESEFGSFKNYLLRYFKEYPVKEVGKTTSSISDELSKDLYKRGMRFVGSTIIYSYLQAIGLINSHDDDCDVKL